MAKVENVETQAIENVQGQASTASLSTHSEDWVMVLKKG